MSLPRPLLSYPRTGASSGGEAVVCRSSDCRGQDVAGTRAPLGPRLGAVEDSGFARAVRRWRERVTPEAVGVRTGGRRRAVGLRREELAGLAVISVGYLTRLEQARATSPSAPVVEAIARSLRLSDAERGLLFRLAGLAAPGPGVVPTRITPGVQRLLDRLAGVPLVIYDAAWNLVVASAPYDALMGETSAVTGHERNAVWRNVVGQRSRATQTAEKHTEQVSRLVADLHLPTSRATRSSSTRPSARSPSSATFWSSRATTFASWPTRPRARDVKGGVEGFRSVMSKTLTAVRRMCTKHFPAKQ